MYLKPLIYKKFIFPLLILVWFLISLVLPRYFDAHNPYDHSWMSVLADGGSDYIFTYGPLSWIFLPDLAGVSFLKIFLRVIIFSSLFIPLAQKLFSIQESKIKVVGFFIAVLLVLTAPYFKYDLFFYLSYWLILQKLDEKEDKWLLALIVWTFVAPLYKFSFLPLALLMNAYAFLSEKSLRRKIGLNTFITILLQFFVVSHFSIRLEQASSYSEYMAAFQNGSWTMSNLMLLLCGVLIFYLFKRKNIALFAILLFSLFIQFKHAVILGTPGYAFYLFFLPFSILLWLQKEKISSVLSLLCLWMLPFYVHYMGGYLGLLQKFSNSLMFKPNLPTIVAIEEKCKDRLFLLDHFQLSNSVPCKARAFPSVQFYGMSPISQVAKLNFEFLNRNTPEKIYFSATTFGNRNAISEISYLFKDLLEKYDIQSEDTLYLLQKKTSPSVIDLDCKPHNPASPLVKLKIGCEESWTYHSLNLLSLAFKSPEYRLEYGNSSQRVFLTSLRAGVYSYLGATDDLKIWWNNFSKLPVFVKVPFYLKVPNGLGPWSTDVEKELNNCLEVSYCRIGKVTK